MKSLAPALAAIGVFVLSSYASAAQTKTLEPNPNAKAQGSCVGVFSSRVRHNGQVVREQAKAGMRAQEVRNAREANCETDKATKRQ